MKHLCRLLVIYASHKPVCSSHAAAHTEKLACPTVLVSANITGGSLYTRPLTSTEQLEIMVGLLVQYVIRIFYWIGMSYGAKYSVRCLLKNFLVHRILKWNRIFLKHILHVNPPFPNSVSFILLSKITP